MSYDTQVPFIASYLIFEKDGKVAFLLRANTGWMDNFYGLPSGKVEKGESYIAAAIREANEEVGADLKPEDLELIHIAHRNEPSEQANGEWVDVFFRVKNWTGELVNAEPEIHSELTWLDLKNLPDNVVVSLRSALEVAAKGTIYSEYGWED